MSYSSEDYEELDSFTENIIKRTKERQKLLNNENTVNDSNDSHFISNHSQSSLKSDSILLNDSKSNIKLNESLEEPVVDSASKQLLENLSKISPNQKRVPLSQRLNSIARTYTYEDSENIEYIDDSHSTEDKANIQMNRSPTKVIRQTANTPIESPPKKRLLLNERLNQIAKNYDNDDPFNEQTVPSPVLQTNYKTSKCQSPTKKVIHKTVDNRLQNSQQKSDSIYKKSPIKGSPIKKETNSQIKDNIYSEELSPNKSKIPVNVSPVKKSIESNGLKEKLSHFGFQKSVESVSPQKSIYNSIENKKEMTKMSGSSNVSAVRKQFEPRTDPMAETPETLSLKAKTDLFEKAISAENDAKSKQYFRKRNAPEVRPGVKINDKFVANNRVMNTNNAFTTNETSIKRQKSSEQIIETKTSVANNILLRKQLLEEKLFGSETTTTANAYKKELEIRQNEIESLKRPLKRNQSEKLNNIPLIKDNKQLEELKEDQELQIRNQSYESIDDETAQQTVSDAFEHLENYSNPLSAEESFNESVNYDSNSLKSESKLVIDKNIELNTGYESPTKNRLYPQLFAEPNELCVQTTNDPEFNPPEKPPRIYQQTTGMDTTPLRTISFYRREKSVQENKTPSLQNEPKKYVNKNENNLDLAERNRKIQQTIDELKEKVEENNRIAGQASQALNLCLERDEFKGSTERVEAEKVLLLSGQRRIAFLNEIQKLKNKLNTKSPEKEASEGFLALSDFILKIKPEFYVSRANGNVPEVHHFICLVYNGADVKTTSLLNTENDIKNGSLNFDFAVQTPVSSDFHIVVHIYDLMTIKYQMSHEIKYHIKRTPKKNKSTMKSPTVRSPGGPNAVMSTSFRLVGAVNINLKNYHKNNFRLENFDYNCPLEGDITLNSKIRVEHPFHKEGFFDLGDSSGFWNLRWVVLNGHLLKFWRFPEDTSTKPPLAVIDLKNCINPKIRILPSHLAYICMRRNTIAFICVDNTNHCKNIFTKGGSIHRSRPSKFLICGADKQQCIEWSEYLTTALSNIRLWEVDAVKPYSEEEYEKLLKSLN